MPDDTVETAVEKLVQQAPSEEKAEREAPAADTGKKDEEAPPQKPETEEEGYTAFEQELIGQLSEEDKAAFEASSAEERKKYLAFAKRIYRDNAKQMTELGTYRKALTALREAGVTQQDLVNLIDTKRGKAPVTPTEVKSQETRGFKRLLAQAKTPEEREIVMENEQVIREFLEDLLTERLGKEVSPLRERLEATERQRMTQRLQTIDQEINALEDELGYPGSLVETHRESMRRLGLREPDLSAEDLLVRAAGFQTVKKAMLKMAEQETGEGEKETSSRKPPASVVKKPGEKKEMPRNSRGVVSVSKAVDLLIGGLTRR